MKINPDHLYHTLTTRELCETLQRLAIRHRDHVAADQYNAARVVSRLIDAAESVIIERAEGTDAS